MPATATAATTDTPQLHRGGVVFGRSRVTLNSWGTAVYRTARNVDPWPVNMAVGVRTFKESKPAPNRANPLTTAPNSFSEITVTDTGTLECECSESEQTASCRHVQMVMKENDDAVSIRLLLGRLNDPGIFVVPIFKQPELTVEVRLAPYKDGSPILSAEVMFDAHRASLGFLMEGEGRMSLRRMVLDYLIAMYPQTYCEGEFHNTYDFGPDDTHAKIATDKAILHSVFQIMDTGECNHCIETRSNLIPDVTMPRWKS